MMTAKVLPDVERVPIEGIFVPMRKVKTSNGETYWVNEETYIMAQFGKKTIPIEETDWVTDDGRKVAIVGW